MKTMGIDTDKIKFNIETEESKAEEKAKKPRLFKVESNDHQSATDAVRSEI